MSLLLSASPNWECAVKNLLIENKLPMGSHILLQKLDNHFKSVLSSLIGENTDSRHQLFDLNGLSYNPLQFSFVITHTVHSELLHSAFRLLLKRRHYCLFLVFSQKHCGICHVLLVWHSPGC